jgi:hypothetical protein
MKIFLHNFRTWAKPVLHRCGYKYREKEKDFIREEASGRFHAKVLDAKVIDIHFDLYVEWRHVSGFHMPMKHNVERKRIISRIQYMKFRELSPEEWRKLQAKYG